MTTTNEGTARPGHGNAVQKTGSGSGSAGAAAVGGVLGALAASACCILPLVLFGVGVGGTWVSNLTALAPYQPIFVTFTVAVLALGFWRVYRPQRACAEGEACARPLPSRIVKVALWLATALIGAALAFPYLASLFLPS